MTLKEFKREFDKIYSQAKRFGATDTHIQIALFDKYTPCQFSKIESLSFGFTPNGFCAEMYAEDFLTKADI